MVRTALAFCGIGCAIAYACRGEWGSAALAGAGVVLAVAFWVRGEFADTRAMMRVTMRQPAPEPAPRPVMRPVTPPRPAKPPWLTAPRPAVPAEPVPEEDRRQPARWQQEARVRFPSSSVR